MKRILYLLLIFSASLPTYSQMLFSENLTMNIDSTKSIQGTLLPVLDFKTEKKNILTFKNTANLNLLIKRKRVINFINKLEFSTYGKKVMVSGGYVHSEYRYLLDKAFEFEKWENPNPGPSTGMYAYSRSLKSHLSLSFRHQLGDHWEITTTAIHQGKPDSYLKKARFGGALDLKYNITPTIGLRGAYRIIYDTSPIVPIRKDFDSVDVGLDISF